MFGFTPENYFISLSIADQDFYSVENFVNQTYFEIEFHRYLPNPNVTQTSDIMIEDVQNSVKCAENKIAKNITNVFEMLMYFLDFKFDEF
jgi:hypothetical protein